MVAFPEAGGMDGRERESELEEEGRMGGSCRQVELRRGARVEAWCEESERWQEAEVVEVNGSRDELLVEFVEGNNTRGLRQTVRVDDRDSVAPLGSRRHRRQLNHQQNAHSPVFSPWNLRVGQCIYVQELLSMEWFPAVVVEEDPARGLRVQYDGDGAASEWLGSNELESRVRPFSEPQLHVNDHLAKSHIHAHVPHKSRRLASLSRVDAAHRRAIEVAGERYSHYQSALERLGLRVHPIEGDGNCLFRSVSHQMYGADGWHGLVREKCMDYMESEATYFEPYIEGDMEDFLCYVQGKRENGVWGDDPELQALCELYDCTVEVWAYDRHEGAKRLRTLHESNLSAPSAATGEGSQSICVMRLSYYGGGHYDSVVPLEGAWVGLKTPESVHGSPGTLEDSAIQSSRSRRALPLPEASSRNEGQRQGLGASNGNQDPLQYALQRSREEFDAQFDDLDAALTASMENFEESQILKATDDSELISLQEQMILTAQAESEDELLKAAIKASATENQGGFAAAKDDMERQMFLSAIMNSMAQENPDHVIMHSADFGCQEEDDEELRRAILMSLLDDPSNT